MNLAGCAALVTGASSGIGEAVARELAARGARLLLVARDASRLRDVAATCGPNASGVELCALDLTRDGVEEELRVAVVARFGRLDVLVHAAGVLARGAIDSLSVADLDRMYRTNLRAPYAITQSLLPLLRESAGQVVFMNSTAGFTAAPQLGAYAALKHALRSLADTVRTEANPSGVRVISVFPGRTATPMQEALHQLEGRPYAAGDLLQPADVAGLVVNALALPRTAEVTELRVRPMLRPGVSGIGAAP